MAKDLQSQRNAPAPVGALRDSFDMQGCLEPRSLAKEVGDSAETTYENEMYVTPKVVDRWKEIHWLCIDARCWKATYGPNTRGWTHLHESKDADGKPWSEWTGKQPHDHHSNSAREKARKDLWWDIAIHDYTGLVDAMVGERISIAAEMIMVHLSINVRMCHASQKKGRWAVGKQSLPDDITRARGFSRGMEDQIEMIQCIRGRIVETIEMRSSP
jgi:hypothetical protein